MELLNNDSQTTSTNYIHTDHLGGTNVITDENGEAVEVTDYYPFGEQRVNTGTFTEQRKFTGHEYDDDTDLTYAKQRYYEQDVGKFMSQDPVAANKITNPDQLLQENGWSQQKLLAHPQLLNTYSYAGNNPLVLKDPEGEFGVFIQGGVSGDAGVLGGFAGSVSFGGGFTVDKNLNTEFGGYRSNGFLIGGSVHSTTLKGVDSSDKYHTTGLSGGLGGGITLTNATQVSQLSGISDTYTFTFGIGSIQWSSSADGIWSLSISYGPNPAASFSVYPTETNTTASTKSVTSDEND